MTFHALSRLFSGPAMLILSTILCAAHADAREVKMAFGEKIPPYCIPESDSGIELDIMREALAVRGLETFILIDDDRFVCEAVVARYPRAHIVKVPSQCCAYLAGAQCDA